MNEILREDFKQIAEQVDLERLSGKTVLVTGSHGFIGSYLVRLLAHLGTCEVIGMDNFITGDRSALSDIKSDKVRLRELDISSEFAFMKIKSDYVLHAASIAAPKFYKAYPLETMRASVLGTWNLLEWAVTTKVLSLVHLSSSEVYGDPKRVPTPESHWGHTSFTGPRSVYDESKRFSETLCATYHREFDVSVKVVRPFNIFGPGMRLDDGRVIPNLVKAILERGTFTIYGDGSDTRSYCYVSDAAVQILSVMLEGSDGEAYNVGCDMEMSLNELGKFAQQTFKGLMVEYIEGAEERRDAPRRRRPDLSKILKIAPRPIYGLRIGLERTLRSYD